MLTEDRLMEQRQRTSLIHASFLPLQILATPKWGLCSFNRCNTMSPLHSWGRVFEAQAIAGDELREVSSVRPGTRAPLHVTHKLYARVDWAREFLKSLHPFSKKMSLLQPLT